jgi:hypothetical protein
MIEGGGAARCMSHKDSSMLLAVLAMAFKITSLTQSFVLVVVDSLFLWDLWGGILRFLSLQICLSFVHRSFLFLVAVAFGLFIVAHPVVSEPQKTNNG